MEIIAHKYLTKLRIIAKIPENGQLDLTNNDLNIYSPGWANWIHRKISGDGKLNTVGFLKTFYQEIIAFTCEIMTSISLEPNRSIKRSRYALLTNIAEKIKESQSGFVRLKRTYQNYPNIISMLESIEQDLIETQLRCIFAFLPSRTSEKLATIDAVGMSDPVEISRPVEYLHSSSPDSSPEPDAQFARQPPNTPS
jgi:hypothetical protein